MRILSKTIAIFIVTLMFLSPLQLCAQRSRPASDEISVMEQAQADAKADAKKDVNMNTWAACGCIPILGVGYAHLYARPPKEERLIGKSAEYVQAYTEAYKSETKAIQTKSAMLGCCVSILLGIIGFAVYQETQECCTGDFNIWPDCSW